MSTSFEVFERLKERGVRAFREGRYAEARACLLEAAEAALRLAEGAATAATRRRHEDNAELLLDLARQCDRRREARHPDVAAEASGGADAADWLVAEKPQTRFDDIAGLEEVKDEVRLRMIYPLRHRALAERYGIRAGGGLLLYGPPGTGKTMIARAIAHEIDGAFFVISPAQILSKWVGEAEQNVRKLFQEARRRSPSVIFLDEVEALVPRRSDSGSRVMARVVPQILQELEGFERPADRPLLFVGATNKPWLIDEAMLRPGRFDTHIYVPLPDAAARYRLLEIYLGSRPLGDDVDLAGLCDRLEGFSGADIRNLAERAAAIPFLEAVGEAPPRPIRMSDIEQALHSVRPSVSPRDLARFEAFAQRGLEAAR